MITNADYVIVGAGSAGCVLASRLSEDPTVKVVLIEAGGADRSLMIHMPVGYAKTIGNPRFDWCYQSGPEPGMDGRMLHYARGKVLGGSSSINGLMWVRGGRLDYDRWLALGCAGWGYDDMLPFLVKAENYAPGGEGRGSSGPVPIAPNPSLHRSMQYLLDAARTLGLPDLPDYNVEAPLGLSRTQLNWLGGRRQSAAATYLAAARGRSNLMIMTGVDVRSIAIKNGAATGVNIMRDGAVSTVGARGEVILSAGTLGSPLLLEASGIGAPERLVSAGVTVAKPAPEVGENLRDHLYIMTQHRLRGLGSLNAETRGWRGAINAVRYLISRTGMLAETPIQLTGFVRTDASVGPPDIQVFGSPLTYAFKAIKGQRRAVVAQDPGMTISFYQRYPRSTGHVHQAGPGRVSLLCGFLTDEEDRRTVAAGLRWCRALARADPLGAYTEGLAPGPEVADDDDAALLEFARTAGNSGFHAVGTCRMGPDPDSVVDLELRARAVRRLRIVDASVMPAIVGVNTHAPTVAIAERAAMLIRNRLS